MNFRITEGVEITDDDLFDGIVPRGSATSLEQSFIEGPDGKLAAKGPWQGVFSPEIVIGGVTISLPGGWRAISLKQNK